MLVWDCFSLVLTVVAEDFDAGRRVIVVGKMGVDLIHELLAVLLSLRIGQFPAPLLA